MHTFSLQKNKNRFYTEDKKNVTFKSAISLTTKRQAFKICNNLRQTKFNILSSQNKSMIVHVIIFTVASTSFGCPKVIKSDLSRIVAPT